MRRQSLGSYYAQIGRIMLDQLEKEPVAKLLSVDKEEYLDHLVAQAAWARLEWYEDRKTVEQFSTKQQRQDPFGEAFTADIQLFRLRVPISSHPQRQMYFNFWPSTYRLSGEPDWKFEGDVLIVETEASAEAVERALEDIRFWIGGRNKDIEAGNATLKDQIRPIWERKRNQLEAQHDRANAELAKLGIPLHDQD
ncbi:MAG: hypothetical protein OXC94_10500 [Chloroflexi bacterium]|nr:hypothetical protein [Chloroflexota bacterium]